MTKSQQATVKMSLLPLVIIVLLILGAGFLLLKGDLKFPKFNKGPTVRRLEVTDVVYTDKEVQKQRRVIKTQEELNDFLNYVDSTGSLVLKENINFDKEMLIGVSTNPNPETGHKTKIKKIYESADKNKLVVVVEEYEKGKNCTVENDRNVAIDIVAISKTDKEIDFERVKKVEECTKDEPEAPATETNGTDTTGEGAEAAPVDGATN